MKWRWLGVVVGVAACGGDDGAPQLTGEGSSSTTDVSTTTTTGTTTETSTTDTTTDTTTETTTTTTTTTTATTTGTTGSTGTSGSTGAMVVPCLWGMEAAVEMGAAAVGGFPRIGFDGTGDALAVMQQGAAIVGNRYDATGMAWGTEVTVSGAGVQDFPADPDLGVGSGGEAIAVWDVSGLNPGIYASVYDPMGDAWGGQALISDGGNGADPRVAVDPAGNAVAVWSQGADVFANRYDATMATWGTAEVIDIGVDAASGAQVGVDAAGNAHATWFQGPAMAAMVYVNRYDAMAGTWGTAEAFDSGLDNARDPALAVASTGEAVVVWLQGADGSTDVYAATFDPGGSAWGMGIAIETGAGAATRPRVGIDDSGNAVATWRQDDGNGVIDFVANIYDAGAWGIEAILEDDDATVRSPRVAVSGDGTAVALWRQSDGVADSIWAACFDGMQWSPATNVETGAVAVTAPEVAIDAMGNAGAIWIAGGDALANAQ